MKKQIVVTAASLLALGAAAVHAAPASLSANADVIILQQIAITENANLDFGTIDKPSSGSQTFTVSAAGAESAGTGDGSVIATGGAGVYGVSGTAGQAYTFSVTAGSCSDAGLSLGSMTHNASGVLNESVGVGGTLTVASSAGAGAKTCAYTVSAQY